MREHSHKDCLQFSDTLCGKISYAASQHPQLGKHLLFPWFLPEKDLYFYKHVNFYVELKSGLDKCNANNNKSTVNTTPKFENVFVSIMWKNYFINWFQLNFTLIWFIKSCTKHCVILKYTEKQFAKNIRSVAEFLLQ